MMTTRTCAAMVHRKVLFAVLTFTAVVVTVNYYHMFFFTGSRTSRQKPYHKVSAPMADATAGSGNARMIVENQNQNRNRDKGEVKLIILSYMRSGSTFTGDLFNQHPEVLYFYEPLWSFDFHFKKGRALSFPNGRSRIKYNESDPKQLSSLQEDTLRSIFSCQFTNVNHRVLGAMAQTFSDVHTRRLQDYARCYRRYTNWQDCWRNCLWKLLDVCQASRVTVVKTLRLGMAQALNLLEADPGVKVVHLVRDPRGVLNSRQVTGIGLSSGETAGELCSRVLQDVRDSVPVRTMYPGRILTVRYEDLTADPLSYAEHLLKFTGLDFSPEHRQYVWNITSTKENIRKRVGSLQRGDSKSTASMWRLQIKSDFANQVDQKCSALYQLMGYMSLSEESELRDLNRPFHTYCSDVPTPLLCIQ